MLFLTKYLKVQGEKDLLKQFGTLRKNFRQTPDYRVTRLGFAKIAKNIESSQKAPKNISKCHKVPKCVKNNQKIIAI